MPLFLYQKPVKTGSDHIAPSWNLKEREGVKLHERQDFQCPAESGRSFMLPIAILPVAGLLLGIGSSFTNATTIETYGLTAVLGEGTILHALLVIMSK